VTCGGVLPLRCIDDLINGLTRSNHAAVVRFLWGQQGSKEEERAEGVETACQSRGAGLTVCVIMCTIFALTVTVLSIPFMGNPFEVWPVFFISWVAAAPILANLKRIFLYFKPKENKDERKDV